MLRLSQPNPLERGAVAGESPVGERRRRSIRHLSRARHVKAGLNPGGPSPKAKYSLTTDSEPSSASERWEEPRQGEDSEPETTCLQALRALWEQSQGDGVPFA
jgi:hypothetical protein